LGAVYARSGSCATDKKRALVESPFEFVWNCSGALERTRTSTPERAQALNLLRMPIPPPGHLLDIIHASFEMVNGLAEGARAAYNRSFCRFLLMAVAKGHQDMRIVLDAMGSDQHPVPDVEGAVLAAREYGDTVILVGNKPQIEAELAKHNVSGLPLEIVHTPEKVLMTDKPGVVWRSKSGSSMHVGMRLVKDGTGDAFVTVGNTGMALAIATLHVLKRIRGIHRPALSTILPIKGHSIILLDIGANTDCQAEWLVQFALMGSLYAERALGLTSPRVALLSNGEESVKGSALVQETAELLSQSGVNFIGNAEPKEILGGGVDVAVMDGFSGNVLIKGMEALGSTLFDLIRVGRGVGQTGFPSGLPADRPI
jgi:glycerol-3-phosphate acyltransferase PlsX